MTLRGRELAGLCGLAFLLLASYAVARPATESLFLAAYTQTALPAVWLVGAAGMAVVVGVYNHFARRVPILRLYLAAAALAGAALVLLLIGVYAEVPGVRFALYVWKDAYIVLLVEMFWSIANLVFTIDRARWTYGLFCAAGSLGAVGGNFGAAALARHIGTVHTLWFILPLLAAVGFGTTRFAARLAVPLPQAERPRLFDGLRIVRGSSYLTLLLLLIGVTQIVITLIDYVYNGAVLAAYPNTDERTVVMNWVDAANNGGALVLQLAAGLVLRALGVTRVLLLMPLLLGAAVGAFMLLPSFFTMATAKVASKVFDYSLFRAAKEILYIPLDYREKTAGKALIDMFVYRTAKAGASLLILGLGAAATLGGALAGLVAGHVIAAGILVLILGWVVLTFMIARRFRARTDEAG